MRIYRLPLRLITRGHWRGLSYAGKAVLPAIGVHADNNGRCWPGLRLIRELSGCRKHHTTQSGIRSLISRNLLYKEKKGRKNVYFLKGHAILSTGSYYPMSEEFLREFWSRLKPGEKAVFGVLAVKARIESRDDPEFPEGFSEDPDWFGAGEIQTKKWMRLAGVVRSTWFVAIDQLWNKGVILVRGQNRYIVRK